nr:XK-related protein 8 [Zootoca vivipara]
MAWSGCGPSCNAPWPPRYRYWDLAFALMGTAAFLVDLGADAWVAASYLKAGDYHWGGLVLGLLALSSLATQFFSCAWYWSDPPELMEALPTRRTLLVLHILQLGYLYRCFYVLKVGFRVCRTKADKDIAYAVFLSHDISFLRLFETFLESAPQLVLGLYIILCTKKAEIFQVLGICTSFLCIAWALLDYHQTLRSFLREKHKLGRRSSTIYFLWNFLLVCPRILCLALFAVVFPNYISLHFLAVWSAMFLWVTLQGTDFMECAAFEWPYRAVVAVILYFCWFNVAEGKTCYRSAIYYTFLLVDSAILAVSWLWNTLPLNYDSHHVAHALYAALPCYVAGILLRSVYYKCLHPTLQAAVPVTGDEIDNREPAGKGVPAFRQLVVRGHGDQEAIRGHVNRRAYGLAQSFFAGSSEIAQHQGNGTLGDSCL